MSDIQDVEKALEKVEKRVSALERKINKIKRLGNLVIVLGVSFLFAFMVALLCLTWTKDKAIHWPNMIIFESIVIGIVAIIITALVALSRRDPEE